MMRRTITVTLLFLGALCSAQERPYAFLQGDTLRLGNALVERTFLWNDGDLKTIAIKDKAAGIVRPVGNSRPDFILGRMHGEGGVLEVREEPSTALQPSYLIAGVRYTLGSVEVRRNFRIYADVPAIACDTYLRGSLSGDLAGKAASAGDHKNIESTADMASKAVSGAVLDHLALGPGHWRGKAVNFRDVTDWNNNLVSEEEFISYRKVGYKGNLLFVNDADGGIFFLKEAPCPDVQPAYPGNDFTSDFGHFQITGLGIKAEDVSPDGWIRLYGAVTGVYSGGEKEAMTALRAYQKTIRASEDMIMMNTWGDRSQDSKVNEAFCLQELEKAARLGITVFQIDDGWQSGRSPNSKKAGGSFRNIWDNPLYWTPDPEKYPRGLAPVVEKARELGIELGLWYNPSVQNDFADWEKDADAIIGLYRAYGIRIFKIDGLQIPGKKAEENLRRLFDKVLEETSGAVVFNLDATAGRRPGYNWFGEYGNIFLENRYTDWGNYYPYQTLRNLWMLSRYVPAERLQIEFLNNWRNADKYPAGDPYAPANYSFEYLAAITFAGQPLAWMEASNLPEEAFKAGKLIRAYASVMKDFHGGVILPVGDEPSGRSWTGFQSISGREGYLLVYREDNPSKKTRMKTWLPAGARVRLTPVLGSGKKARVKVAEDGTIRLKLSKKNSFALYKYSY